MKRFGHLLLFFVVALAACAGGNKQNDDKNAKTDKPQESHAIIPGADQLSAYLPLLERKKISLMRNQTSIDGHEKEQLIDVLLREDVDLKVALAPEHEFRGDIERSEKVDNTVDKKTGLTL